MSRALTTRCARRTLLALLVGLASCVDHQSVASYADGQHYLSFAGVACVPDIFGGEAVETGQRIECIFRVEGVARTAVSLTCETDQGAPVACNQESGPVRLLVDTDFPEDAPNPPVSPMARCRFSMDTGAPAGELVTPLVWVATDGEHTIRKRFAPTLVADDGVDVPPEIWVDCERQTLDHLHRGERLNCFLFVSDPDPGDGADFAVTLIANPGPPPGPLDAFPMQGMGPGIALWSWQTHPQDPPGVWTWSFTVPGTAARYDLDVTLQ